MDKLNLTLFSNRMKSLGHLQKTIIYIPLNGRRKKQKERDSMFFAETPGLSNTVSFKDMTGDILNDK